MTELMSAWEVGGAVDRVAGAAEVIGVRAVLIHCESDAARTF